MSKYDKEREALGGQPVISQSSASFSSSGISSNGSKYAAERQKMTNPIQSPPPGYDDRYDSPTPLERDPFVPEQPQQESFTDKLTTTFAPEINAIKSIPQFIGNLPGMVKDAVTGSGEQIMNSDELPGRNTPVIGPVLRGLDTVANNKLVQTIGGLGRNFYVPGAPLVDTPSLSGIGSFTNSLENGISRILPGIENNAAGRFAQSAATNVALGGLLGTGQALTSQTNDLREALDSGLVGGVLGGVLGGGGGLLREASQAARNAAESGLGNAIVRGAEDVPKTDENIFSRNVEEPTPNEQPMTEQQSSGSKYEDERQQINNPTEENPTVQEARQALRTAQDDLGEFEVKAQSQYGPEYKNHPDYRTQRDDLTDEIAKAKVSLNDATKAEIETESVAEPVKQNWFSRLFGEDNGLGITPFGSKKSTRMVSTEQQIVKNPLINNVKGKWETAKQGGRAAYQSAVDYLSPLKTITKETYNTAMDAARANNIANTIVQDKFVDLQGNVIGSSINDIMKSVRGLGKKFDDYLILRHAVTRMNRGERVYDEQLNMTPEKAEEKAAQMEKRYPQLKTAGEMWDKFNHNLPYQMGVKEGMLSQEEYDTMKTANPHYASMRRQFTIGEKLAQPKFKGGGSGFSGQSAPIQEVSPTGSVRKIVSPIRSAIEQTYAWTNAALRNRVGQEIMKAIQLDPKSMEGIARIVKKPTTSFKDLRETLREGGSEAFLDQLENDYKNLFQKHNPGDENVIRVMVKGDPVYVQIDNPEAAKALLGMGSEQAGIVLSAFQKLSNATKRGATGVLAPMFAVKNLTSDTIQAAIQSPNFIRHIGWDVPAAFFSSIGEALHIPGLKNLAEEYKRSGGEYSSLLRGDRPLNRSVYELRKYAPLSPQGIVKGGYNLVKGTAKAFEKLGDITENTNRMAAYRREMAGKERTPEYVRAAINAARESTTNFSRRGSISREVEAVIPYSNAAIQGIYRVGVALGKNPVKTLGALGMLVIAPKLYEYANFNNDPDYRMLPARERYRNLIMGKNADGTFKKIPMPPEYAAFGALMTDIMDKVINKDPQAYKGTLDALANAWTPPAVSGALQGATQGGGPEQSMAGFANATVAAPYIAALSNKSFTGAPIVSKAVEGRSPQNQYDEKTSSVAKYLGQKMGYSPMKIDYLLRSYGGDPSRLLLPLTSDVGGGTPRNTMLRNFIVDPVLTNNLSNDYYGARDNLSHAFKDNKDVGAPLPSWFDVELYKATQPTSPISKTLSGLSAQKKLINGNAGLSAEQKAQQIREIQRKINTIYADINAKLYEKGVPMK